MIVAKERDGGDNAGSWKEGWELPRSEAKETGTKTVSTLSYGERDCRPRTSDTNARSMIGVNPSACCAG
jgi:hypothetical protein